MPLNGALGMCHGLSVATFVKSTSPHGAGHSWCQGNDPTTTVTQVFLTLKCQAIQSILWPWALVIVLHNTNLGKLHSTYLHIGMPVTQVL